MDSILNSVIANDEQWGVTACSPQRPQLQGLGFVSEAVGVPRGYAPLVAGHLKVSEKGRQRKRWKGEREAVPPPRSLFSPSERNHARSGFIGASSPSNLTPIL